MTRTKTILTTLAAVTVAATASLAYAQDTAIAKHACKRPDVPTRTASESAKKAFNSDVEAYSACISKYVKEHQKLADDHIKAANGAAAEYNTAVREMQAQIEKKE